MKNISVLLMVVLDLLLDLFIIYRFSSSSLDSLVRTLVDNNHKTLKNLSKEIVDNDDILNIVNELEEEDRTIEDLKKDYPNEIENIEKVLLNYFGKAILNF